MEFLTTSEAADYLRLGERKLYELVTNGAIPCTKVTGKWLFPRHELDLWVLSGLARPAGMLTAEPPPARASRRPSPRRTHGSSSHHPLARSRSSPRSRPPRTLRMRTSAAAVLRFTIPVVRRLIVRVVAIWTSGSGASTGAGIARSRRGPETPCSGMRGMWVPQQ